MQKLRQEPTQTRVALRVRVRQHWEELTPHYMRALYRQLPRRVAELCRARRYPTNYSLLTLFCVLYSI